MSLSPEAFLRHIVGEMEYLRAASANLSLDDYLASPDKRRAFARSLEIIGEAVKNLSKDYREAHPNVEWSKMAAMRDRLIHGYFAVDEQIVWQVVTENIPPLHEQLLELLTQKQSGAQPTHPRHKNRSPNQRTTTPPRMLAAMKVRPPT